RGTPAAPSSSPGRAARTAWPPPRKLNSSSKPTAAGSKGRLFQGQLQAVFRAFPASPHPGEVRLVTRHPRRREARQEIQVIRVVTGRGDHRVVAFAHQRGVTRVDLHNLVEAAVVIVEALQ